MKVTFTVTSPKLGEEIAIAVGKLAVDGRLRVTHLRDAMRNLDKADVCERRRTNMKRALPEIAEEVLADAMELDRIARDINEQIQIQRTAPGRPG